MNIKCPTCGKNYDYDSKKDDNPYFPFCSRRCKFIDLGEWLDGSYSIATSLLEADPDDVQDLLGEIEKESEEKGNMQGSNPGEKEIK